MAVVGFEKSNYSVGESDGSVEVCVTVLGPVGIQLSDNVTAVLSITTQPNTATGKYFFTIYIYSL